MRQRPSRAPRAAWSAAASIPAAKDADGHRPSVPCFRRKRWGTNETNGAHLAVGGSCGIQLAGGREEQGRGKKVISCGLADWKPLWCACVVYQLSKNDKCNSKIFSYVVNM